MKNKKPALRTDVGNSPTPNQNDPVAVTDATDVRYLSGTPVAPTTAQLALQGFLAGIGNNFFTTNTALLDQAWNGLQGMMRDREQPSEILETTAKPGSYVKMLPAVAVVMEHQQTISEALPAAAPLLRFLQMQDDAAWLARIQKRREGTQNFAEGYVALESQIAQKVYRPLQSFFTVAEGTLAVHRTLKPVYDALNDLFNGSAQKGVDSRRQTARAVSDALAEQDQEGDAGSDAGTGSGTTVTTTTAAVPPAATPSPSKKAVTATASTAKKKSTRRG